MKAKHLTDDDLLDLAGRRLSGDARRSAEEHVSKCASCRQSYQDFLLIHSAIEQMTEIGYQKVLRESVHVPLKRPRAEFIFPWGPVLAITLSCICVMVVMFYSRAIPAVSADELLSNAVRNENHAVGMSGFRLRVGEQVCAGGDRRESLVSLGESSRCRAALQHMKATRWGHSDPLSPRTYIEWRDSLKSHQDKVTKKDVFWELTTTTEDDVVRAASLELLASDFHVAKLTIDFADNEEISISEDLQSLPPNPDINVARMAVKTTPPQPKFADNPSDLLEVQAWTILRQLSADPGWDGMVLRDGDEVRVEALVDNESRKQEISEGFAAYAGITLDVYLPGDAPDSINVFAERDHLAGDDPPLATELLKQHFSSADERTLYSNRILQLSQEILGRAFFLDRLQARQTALAHCSCAQDMAGLVENEGQALQGFESELSVDLQPVIGSQIGAPSHLVTLDEARRLDRSLEELFWRGSGATDSTFEKRVDEVRQLISAQ
jgi:hypothetical protein